MEPDEEKKKEKEEKKKPEIDEVESQENPSLVEDPGWQIHIVRLRVNPIISGFNSKPILFYFLF